MSRRFGVAPGLAVLTAALVGIAGACGGAGPSGEATGGPGPVPSVPRGGKVEKIAVVTPEKANDYGWNQQGVTAARAAAARAGAKLEVADGVGYENIEPILDQLASEGAQLVIAHTAGYNVVAPEFARQAGVPVIVYDRPEATTPGLVADVEISCQEAGYLAGILAARTTRTRTIGIVESADDPDWHKQAGGFVAGARSVAPDVKILLADIGQAAYADAAGGKRVADSLIAGGADVVFGMGDGSSFGMLQAVETATPPPGADRVWLIDAVGDKTPIDEQGVILSSVVWDFTRVFEQALADLAAGTFGAHGYDLNAANGVSLLRTGAIPDELWHELEAARQTIVAGSVEVPFTPKLEDVRALIAGRAS